MTNSPRRLLTVADVAEILVCSSGNVYALIERGELPYVQTGVSKGYRIDQDDLATFIRSRKRQNGGDAKAKPSRPQLKHLRI